MVLSDTIRAMIVAWPARSPNWLCRDRRRVYARPDVASRALYRPGRTGSSARCSADASSMTQWPPATHSAAGKEVAVPHTLVTPHGGKLTTLLVDPERQAEIKAASRTWPSWTLTPRQLCDLELLLNGGFSPLSGFLRRADYDSVCADMRLTNGVLWPMPIVLDVADDFASGLRHQTMVALRDPEGVLLAALHVEDVWRPDRAEEARQVYGTTSEEHPGVAHLMRQMHALYVGGAVEGVQLPTHYDYRQLRLTPEQVRAEFVRLGWRRVVAFQTRNPLHRAHRELTVRAAQEMQANLLVHPAVGMTKPGDVDHYTRVRCYQAVLPTYPAGTAMLALLPLAMRMGGPREAVWHAIIRKNHGCSH